MLTLIDLSHPITSHIPIYPGDELPLLEKVKNTSQDRFNNYRWSTNMHVGTHIDGPMHMTDSRQFIGDIPVARCMGTGCLIQAAGEKVVLRKTEYTSQILPESIVLVYTGFGKKFGCEEYFRTYPTISRELAQLFVDKHVKMVCFDTPSPDQPPYDLHELLLKNRILIAENLRNVEQLLPVKHFEVFAFPLRIHADSSPARIVARILE
jgi:kynurenine formamidase